MKQKILSIVGSNIRKMRKQQRLTIKQLAKNAGLSEKYLQRVEVGKRNISIVNIASISEALDVDVHLLFQEDTTGENPMLFSITRKLKHLDSEKVYMLNSMLDTLSEKHVDGHESIGAGKKIEANEDDLTIK